jgi:2-oxoglutarate dehydrogenase E2 component (dihydrolipoamide succinyltransferase)
MAVDIVMPQAGESVTSGVIAQWLKKPGDYVKRDEEVVSVETDKVNLGVPAPASGVLTEVRAKVGDTVAIGQVLAVIDEKATAGAPAPAPKASVPAAAVAPIAASAAVPAASNGSGSAHEDVRATPLAKKVAAEHGVDLAALQGTGAGGRVREQDVMGFVESRKGSPATASAVAAPARAPAQGAMPAVAGSAPSNRDGATRERMTPLRQRIAQRLVYSKQVTAMLTTFNEADMTNVMELRKSYKDDFEKKHGIGLGFMSFFVKAVVRALQEMPMVNASIVDDGNGQLAIEKHSYCDVAIAVSTPKGLVVPVLRNADTMSFAQIEQGIKDLATKARDGKLTLEEMQGGTFTITNGGVFGSLMATPIINPPQSGILGMHAIKNRPIEYPTGSGQVAVRPMMYLALSYDHRIIDGAESVGFLVKVKNYIEDPRRLLLEV